MSRDETAQRPPDWSPDRHQANRQRTQGSTAQYAPQRSDPHQQRTVPQPQPSPSHHPAHGQTASAPSAPGHQHSGPAVDSQPYMAIPAPASSTRLSGPPEVQPRRRVSADQIHAAHKEARLEARQVLKEEAHTEGLLKSRKAVLPSEIRRREKSVDDPHRGSHEDMDWQNCSPERRRMSRGEEDWDRERPRERGRERNVERIRNRTRELDGQEERVFRSMQPSVPQQPRQHQPSERVYHQEPQTQQQEPQTQPQYEPRRRQHDAQVQQQDPQRQNQYQHLRQHQESQRQQQSHRQQEYDLQRQEPTSQQQDSMRRPHEPQQDRDLAPQQQDPPVHQRVDSAVYLQKGSSLPQARQRSMETSGGLKPKVRTRSMSDIGLSQHSAMYRMDRAAAGRESLRAVPPSGNANGEMGGLDTRVSVAQLRHSYLENANRKPEL